MVAQRIGDDPATLLRSYTKRKRTEEADERLDVTIAGLDREFPDRTVAKRWQDVETARIRTC
jgi:hypothetical protein